VNTEYEKKMIDNTKNVKRDIERAIAKKIAQMESNLNSWKEELQPLGEEAKIKLNHYFGLLEKKLWLQKRKLEESDCLSDTWEKMKSEAEELSQEIESLYKKIKDGI
jgi:hypothetical protein